MSPMKPFDSLRAGLAARPSSGGRSKNTRAPTSTSSSATSLRRGCPRPFDAVERRSFLKLMGASLALAGMAGCTRQPPEQILPYVRQPENVVPGRPLFYATAMTLGGRATGLLVESHEGRPTKIEGNPSHPASLGATDVFAQAALLDLYDPDRMRTLTHMGEIFPWSAFIGAMRTAADGAAGDERRRPPHPDRGGLVADARRAD